MNKFLQGCKLAFSFLTIFPVKSEYNEITLKYSVYNYSIVGLVTGLFMYLSSIFFLHIMLDYFWLYALLIFLIENIVSNFLHIDGFCDCIDALYFTKKGKDCLKILKDPHIGAYAVVWLLFLFLFKICGYYYLLKLRETYSLIIIPIAGYVAVPFQVKFLDPIFEDGLGYSFKNVVDNKHLIFSILFLGTISFFLAGFLKMMLILIILTFCLKGCNKMFLSKFNGYNGDTLGFTIEIFKLAVLYVILF